MQLTVCELARVANNAADNVVTTLHWLQQQASLSWSAAGALERVVGSTRSRKMLKNTDTPTYMFC